MLPIRMAKPGRRRTLVRKVILFNIATLRLGALAVKKNNYGYQKRT